MAIWLPKLALALVLMGGINLYAAGLIATERVPMQWGLDGNPTWFAPNTIGFWFPVAITAAARQP